MTMDGEVVFQRNEGDSDSDIWDDTALIKAYDDAVHGIQAKLRESEPECEEMPVGKRHGKKKKKNKKQNSRKEEISRNQWKVGSECRARFSGDGRVYDAVVQSVNSDAATCVVRYSVYDNEEQHALGDLLPPGSTEGRRRADRAARSASENESMDWSQNSRSPQSAQQRSHRDPDRTRSPRGRREGRAGWHPPTTAPMPPLMQMPPFFPTMSMPPMMPPFFGMPSSPGWPAPSLCFPRVLQHTAHFPPPPPPPQIDEESLGGDNEALHSMLIAWYMSGYHTGYYQGLKRGKKQANDAATQREPDTTDADHTRTSQTQ